MAKYINREALLKWEREFYPNDKVFASAIINAPAADVATVVHGLWLHTEEPLGWKDVDCMECSACHDSWISEEDYCFEDMPLWNYYPNCGEKMDGGGGDAVD